MFNEPRDPVKNDDRRSDEAFRFLSQNPLPVAWPCNATLEVVVDLGEVDPAERLTVLTDLQFAFDTIADQTPYSLVVTHLVESTSSLRDLGDILDGYGADLLVTFVVPGQSDLLSPRSLGTGGHKSNGHTARHGWAAFSAPAYSYLNPKPGPYSRHALIVHEVLHALNLGHINDASSVMHPHLSKGAGRIGPGDIAGLEALNEFACSR